MRCHSTFLLALSANSSTASSTGRCRPNLSSLAVYRIRQPTMDRLQAIQDQLLERHRAMSATARAVLWSWAVLQLVVIAAFIIVTPSRIFESERANRRQPLCLLSTY